MSRWVEFAEIKREVGIAQVLEQYRVRLKPVGSHSLRGRCPLPGHQSEGSRESFQVDTGKNVWACHSVSCCATRKGRVGGNVLDLVACLECCSIREAALRVQAWRDIRAAGKLVSKGNIVVEEERCSLRPLSFSLSLWWHPYLERRGIAPQTAAWFGVGYYAGAGFLRERVAFPIHDERGFLVGYAGRGVDAREPRYLFPPGFRKLQVVYNLHRALEPAARQGNWAIVVEGFFDCLKVHQAGYENVVALMGVSASSRQSELLRGHFRDLVVMLDGDEAGRRASQALARRWPAARVAVVPVGRQPDQLSNREIQQVLRGVTSRAFGA